MTKPEIILAAIEATLSSIDPPEERDDDWMVYDATGGNIDDAYSLGFDDGRLWMAQHFRELINQTLEDEEYDELGC